MGIKMFFAGDIVVKNDTDVPLVSDELAAIIQGCDVACCNFEGPVANEKEIPIKKIGPSISQTENTMRKAKEAGFNLICLANNHIMDYGADGLVGTIKVAHEIGIEFIGAGTEDEEVYRPYYYEKNGKKVAIINVAEGGFGMCGSASQGGFAWLGDCRVESYILEMRTLDIDVIVVVHAGSEQCDFPIPEIRQLYKSWIDMGARAVVAHHPHVPQGYEKYGHGVIFYSLGNFAFDKGRGPQNNKTITAIIELEDEITLFNHISVTFENCTVRLMTSEDFENHICQCNLLLQNQAEYMEVANEYCVDKYLTIYRDYYKAVSNYYEKSLKRKIKTLLYRVMLRRKYSDLWAFHNIEIETHYWICRRAMKLLSSRNELI